MKINFFIIGIISILLIAGCSSNEVIKKELYFIPGIEDSMNLTVIDPGLWLGTIEGPKGDSIGSVAVNPISKKAFIKTKTDTLIVYDTLKVPQDKWMTEIVDLLPWWAKLLYGLMIGLTTALVTYIYMRFGRGK